MKWITSIALVVSLMSVTFGGPAIPRPANEFRIVDPSGKTVKLSDCHGKVVVMQFLYTTCSHCQATARMLSKLQEELGPRGFQVLGVAFNPEAQERPGIVDEFLRSNNLDFPVGSASPDAVLAYLGASVMERFVVPQIVIVDRRGVIRAQSELLGSAELQDESYLRSFVGGLLKERVSTNATQDNRRRDR
jgi:peroxiredoxin